MLCESGPKGLISVRDRWVGLGWVGTVQKAGLLKDAALGEPGGEFIGCAASGNRRCLANGPPSDSDTTASENGK